MALLSRIIGKAFSRAGGRRPRVLSARLAPLLGLAGAALGGMALANALLSRRAESRNPPRGRFLQAGGVRFHYLEAGQGSTTVVLLHGNGATAEDFVTSGVMDLLARHHRVIAFDRPGAGYSTRPRRRIWTAAAQADALWQALATLGIDHPVVVGHSWGALVALAMTVRRSPPAAAAVVAISGYVLPRWRWDVLPPSLLALPLLGPVLNHTVAPLLSWPMLPLLFRRIFAPWPVTPRFRAGFAAGLALRPGQLQANASDTALMIPSAALLATRYRRIAVPVVIIAGTGDAMVDTVRQSAALHRRIPRSRFLLIRDAGHMVHHTHPRQVADGIEEAIRAARHGRP
jgi:pimeloyl-ACP methyl ester carboxylesterase